MTTTTAGLPLASQLPPFGCARDGGPSFLLDAPCAPRCSICSDSRSSSGLRDHLPTPFWSKIKVRVGGLLRETDKDLI